MFLNAVAVAAIESMRRRKKKVHFLLEFKMFLNAVAVAAYRDRKHAQA